MTLEDLGYYPELEEIRKNQNLDSFDLGRVVAEHKSRYIVKTAEKEYDAEIIGNLRFVSSERSDFPAVGDWVAISEYDTDKAIIHAVYPRKTIIERQAAGKYGTKQIIATNIDIAFIVQSTDRDFSINRIERYLTICNSANVAPVILLNKIDLLEEKELDNLISNVKARIKHAPVVCISNKNLHGIEELKSTLEKGKTYCLLGSSGVGKSSLLNNLSGIQLMKTNTISTSTNRGRHVTSHRELIVLKDGGIIIDNPGMREVGIADQANGLEITFESITELARNCRFKDCTHTTETGCAVVEAVEIGDIDKASYDNFMKMEKEKEYFESTVVEKRKKDKDFGKKIKNYKKIIKKNKF